MDVLYNVLLLNQCGSSKLWCESIWNILSSICKYTMYIFKTKSFCVNFSETSDEVERISASLGRIESFQVVVKIEKLGCC